MMPRERELAAIRHEAPDRIPVDALAIENSEAIASLAGIDKDNVPERLGLDGRIVSAAYLGPVRPKLDGVAFTEWGTPSTGDYGAARGGYPFSASATVADVEKFAWPDAGAYDYADASARIRPLAGTYAFRGPYWTPLFCRVCDLFGMEEAMIAMAAKPAVFEAALERVFQHTLERAERLMEACGDAMPILCLGDDFATQRGMMISPDQWRRLLKPRYARLFEAGKRRGKFVWFHSCGDISLVLPDLIEIGMDVWETVQLHTLPMSPRMLKREYGRRLTFFGAINTQRLPFATPAAVREEVVAVIKLLARGGGYICGADHHVKPDVPPQNALALYDAATSFRAKGYTVS